MRGGSACAVGVLAWCAGVSAVWAFSAQPTSSREEAIQLAAAEAQQALSARDRAMLDALTRASAQTSSDSSSSRYGTPQFGSPRGPGHVPPSSPETEAPPSGSRPPGGGAPPNTPTAPLVVSGTYRAAMGATQDDPILQQANGDLNERNFRIFSGNLRYNTFDPRIFSRLRVNLDSPEPTGFQFHSNTTVDPWSFVGTTDRVTVVGATPTDQVDLQLKWWSGTNATINETFLTSKNGDSIATPEIETKDGETVATSVGSVFGNTFTIQPQDINYAFQPIRWVWTGYRSDTIDFRLFPLALEDQALTSDDPLHLSNAHIYWEPSPWLDEWVPGRLNTGPTPDDVTRGRWSDDLSFFTRDSDLVRLVGLRGTTLQWQPWEGSHLQAAVASPKGLWQEYSSINSLVGMVRLKQALLDDRWTVGGLYTTRWGFHERHRDAVNHVYSTDTSVTPAPGTTISAQGAASQSTSDLTNVAENDTRGWLWHGDIEQRWGTQLTSRLFYTHMDDSFDPGLASYRETRHDQFWGRHLQLKRRLRLINEISPPSPFGPGELDAVKIGDGVDIGRDAFGARLTGSWWDDRVAPLVDVRNVHNTDNGKYIETVVRNENTLKPTGWLTAKTLFIYHDLPQTIGGIDPFDIDADLDKPLLNAAVKDGRDPSLQTYSLGAEVAPSDRWAAWAIWERTNDSTVATGNFPRGLLNDTSFATATEEGTVIRSRSPFLYGQGFFPQAPYAFFNIYRAGLYVSPAENWELALDGTRNEFEFAGQIDDNLNHIGLTTAWSPVKSLVLVGRYVASWAIDVNQMNAGGGNELRSHHNLYGRLVWKVTDHSRFDVEYGVSAFTSGALFSVDPTGDFYPTLDTEHLVRFVYSGEF